MKYFHKLFLIAIAVVLLWQPTQAQDIDPAELNGGVNTVITSIPFLRINPDGRAGGMGDIGIATAPDANSMYHNMAKLSFAKDRMGMGITYTPWLKALVNDMFIGYVSGYKKLDDLQAISTSIRYFNLGSIQFTNESGIETVEFNPHEFAFDLGYSRRLSDKLAAGLTLKYVYSNLAKGQTGASGEINVAGAVAADLSFYYENDMAAGERDAKLRIGGAISNIGNKVSYTQDKVKDFIPINLSLGSSYTLDLDEHNSITFAAEFNKLLVPTPDTINVIDPDANIFDHREKSLFSGMFGSFADAPGGLSEELREITIQLGAEYWYNDQFAFRAGYFHEHASKGNRKFMTMGLGVKYEIFGLNFSYLIPTAGISNHPLENTLRFTLFFDLDKGMGALTGSE